MKLESETAAPGEKAKFLGVREQRVTGLVVFVFIGLSVFLTKILGFIPMPVLYGVFLYMGISSMKEIQLISRILLIFMPEKYQPDYVYLRHVRTSRVHLFTIIQLTCLSLLWLIKSIKSISILFPIMVVALVGARKLMDYLFTQRELGYLDDVMPELVKKEIDVPKSIYVFEPAGCKKCNGSGYSGRAGVFEVLEMTDSLAEIILKEPSEARIEEEAKTQGMVTMKQDGIMKALQGISSVEEVLRVTEEK